MLQVVDCRLLIKMAIRVSVGYVSMITILIRSYLPKIEHQHFSSNERINQDCDRCLEMASNALN